MELTAGIASVVIRINISDLVEDNMGNSLKNFTSNADVAAIWNQLQWQQVKHSLTIKFSKFSSIYL